MTRKRQDDSFKKLSFGSGLFTTSCLKSETERLTVEVFEQSGSVILSLSVSSNWQGIKTWSERQDLNRPFSKTYFRAFFGDSLRR